MSSKEDSLVNVYKRLYIFVDGRMFGFGFVQFADLTSAEQALQKMNTKMIRGEFTLYV